jgi:hypothetical protein
MARPGKLFHAIVVVGASIGCGGATSSSKSGDGGGAGQPTGPLDGSEPDQGAESAAGDACSGSSGCGPSGPRSMCDCARPAEFMCASCPIGGDPPVNGRCLSGDGTGAGAGCVCDTSVPVAAPTDCPHTQQFNCTAYVGPTAYSSCSCDMTAPLSQSDCAAGTTFQCGGTWPVCLPVDAGLGVGVGGENQRFACYCGPAPIPIQ